MTDWQAKEAKYFIRAGKRMDGAAGAERDIVGEWVAFPFEDAAAELRASMQPRGEHAAQHCCEGRAKLFAGARLIGELAEYAVSLCHGIPPQQHSCRGILVQPRRFPVSSKR